jgi:anthranilate synthase/aminodeoxychorismate synthase-like glutamine amidotransferase
MNDGDGSGPAVLLVDNYDSFTYNLAHLFGALGAAVDVMRNDDARLDEGAVRAHEGIVIGPGPGRPAGAGRTRDVIGWAVAAGRPLFGVCLGEQAIGEFFGGRIDHAPRLMHGKVSRIEHDGTGLFAGVPSPFVATRYHSLCIAREGLPEVLRITATSEDGAIQGIAHRELPIAGVQFHPESVLTADGPTIFANYLRGLGR